MKFGGYHPAYRAGGSSLPVPMEISATIKGPEIPEPMKESPGKDIAELASGFIGDVQGVVGEASGLLDIPFEATVKIPGPHRVVQGCFNAVSGLARGLIDSTAKQF